MAIFTSHLRAVTKIRKRNFFAFGVPFLVLLIGGSFALKHYAHLRYAFRKKTMLSREEAEAMGIKLKPANEAATLESEFERLKNTDIDTWTNIRGPRPWEDSRSIQQVARHEEKK
jgi:cytochrome c oxidase assembly protein subunit 16